MTVWLLSEGAVCMVDRIQWVLRDRYESKEKDDH